MRMTKDYYDAHVTIAIEIEFDDGGRFWKTVVGKDAYHKVCERYCGEISDVDLCAKQEDEKVRDFLNTVEYNKRHNPRFARSTFYEVLDAMLI